jgi:hypothetical protein
VGLRRTSHSGLVLSTTSGWRERDIQASGTRFLSVLSAGRERLRVMPEAGTGLRM